MRQLWPPTSRPHSQTLPIPYWQRLRTTSRGWRFRIAPICRYGFWSASTLGSLPAISPYEHQSYFRKSKPHSTKRAASCSSCWYAPTWPAHVFGPGEV